MRKNAYLVNILLAVFTAAVVLGTMIARAILPTVVVPGWNIPNLVILSVAALVAAEYLNPGAQYCWILSGLLGGLTIALFPFITGIVDAELTWKLILGGLLTYVACERCFQSILDRLSSGPAKKLAPLSVGLTMCLVGQIFSGIFL